MRSWVMDRVTNSWKVDESRFKKYFSNFFQKMLGITKHAAIFASLLEERAKRTVNWLVRLSVRTPDFHSGKTGSTPVQATYIRRK